MNKKRSAEKKKAKRKARLAAYKDKVAQTRNRLQNTLTSVKSLLKGSDTIEPLNEEDYLFWLCHGVNYIASDYQEGVWSPIFDIYDQPLVLPAPEEIATKVMDTYRDEILAEGALKGVSRAVLAWSLMDLSIVTIYAHEAKRRLRVVDPECDVETLVRTPRNPTIWALMEVVKQRSMAAGSEVDTILEGENE